MSKITQKILYAQRTAAGLCTRCSNKVETLGKKKCNSCADKYRTYRQSLREEGKCSQCLINPFVIGYKMCQECLDKQRSKYNSAQESKYRRELMLKHKEQGLCITCTSSHKEGSVQCQECLDHTVSARAKRRLNNIMIGVCASCGKCPAKEGGTNCVNCVQYHKKKYEAHKEKKKEQARINYQSRYNAAKVQVYAAYGNKCKCCNDANEAHFTLDHVDSDGNVHRDTMSTKGGETMLRWIVDNNFPNTIQLLCANCHLSKTRLVPCIH